MNLCFISFHCCPFSLLGGDGTGGMNVYIREITAALSRFPDVTIDVFTRTQNPKIRDVKSISPRVRVIHMKGGPEAPLNRKHLYEFLPEFTRNVCAFLTDSGKPCDLIYSHYWLSGLVGVWIKQKTGLPLLHAYHTLGFLKRQAAEGTYEEHSERISVERHLAHISDRIISSSHYEKHQLLKEYNISPSKVCVVHPGVNSRLFSPANEPEPPHKNDKEEKEKHLLYVGRIEPEKGLLTLVEALSLIKKEAFHLYKRMTLTVIGGGDRLRDHPRNSEINKIKKWIAEKGLTRKVLFSGSKKQNELKIYYSKADVLVMPSLYESFGLVTLEALSCGTPVIASRIGELQTIIRQGENGLLFPAGDSRKLAGRIIEFFSSQNAAWNGDKIRGDALKRFSWGKTAIETYALCREILMPFRPAKTISRCDEIPPPV